MPETKEKLCMLCGANKATAESNEISLCVTCSKAPVSEKLYVAILELEKSGLMTELGDLLKIGLAPKFEQEAKKVFEMGLSAGAEEGYTQALMLMAKSIEKVAGNIKKDKQSDDHKSGGGRVVSACMSLVKYFMDDRARILKGITDAMIIKGDSNDREEGTYSRADDKGDKGSDQQDGRTEGPVV